MAEADVDEITGLQHLARRLREAALVAVDRRQAEDAGQPQSQAQHDQRGPPVPRRPGQRAAGARRGDLRRGDRGRRGQRHVVAGHLERPLYGLGSAGPFRWGDCGRWVILEQACFLRGRACIRRPAARPKGRPQDGRPALYSTTGLNGTSAWRSLSPWSCRSRTRPKMSVRWRARSRRRRVARMSRSSSSTTARPTAPPRR